MKRNQRDSLSRKAMKLLCKLLGIVLVLMLAATAVFQYLLNQINYTDSDISTGDSALSILSPTLLSNSQSGSQDNRIGGNGSDIINILLIGQDRREGEDQARSDSMILCTFHKKTNRLTMTSFLRDLYVEIPGHGSNRINAAYSLGGMRLLDQTLEHNFGLQIDGNVEVDFSQFSGIVDLLGGVEIELRQDEANVINQETGSSLTAGIQKLNGPQALAYSRIRSLDSDGDFSRTNRQRKVITAMLDSYKDIRLNDLIPLLTELLPMITTDLNHGQILMCALEILPHLADTQLVSQRIPADGTYTDQTINGMAVLVADLDSARQLLKETLLYGS